MVDSYRSSLATNASIIDKTDFGTGKSKPIVTKSLAKTSSVSKRYGQLLSGISAFQQPKNLLELGTCLGMSSAYLSIGHPSAKIESIEGCPGTFKKRAELTKESTIFKESFTFVNVDFETYFQQKFSPVFDMAFIDGNHQYEATMKYFSLIWPPLPENGLLIFDDIHWSKGMNDAWLKILESPDMLSIDLYQFGLCWKRTNAKAHSILSI